MEQDERLHSPLPPPSLPNIPVNDAKEKSAAGSPAHVAVVNAASEALRAAAALTGWHRLERWCPCEQLPCEKASRTASSARCGASRMFYELRTEKFILKTLIFSNLGKHT